MPCGMPIKQFLFSALGAEIKTAAAKAGNLLLFLLRYV
jgi:hypothetical protein